MTLTPQWLDELRSRVTLSALVGRTVKITKAGREYKGCCPFHNEKTPSFYVNDEKGFYHCFGCSAHGDAIRWMTDHRGLPFMDAVKELASEAGMEVPAADPQAQKRAEKQSSLHDVMAAAQEFFVRQLGSIEGTKARDYLSQRGIKDKTIAEFGFGFAPDSRTAIKSALGQYDAEMLIEAGLLISVEDKEPYDRFRGRLMIPIRDRRGRVIAFGGRILGDGEPKYLNSPDTPLFDKGRTLYNLDKASPASRATDRIIVAEGYMDVIALAQAGFGDAVAPLGTALTEQQISLLWRMTGTPILCFDGDRAGQKAALRAATRALPMLHAGHSLKFVTLPLGVDPDDLIQSRGSGAFDKYLNDAVPLVDWVWETELQSRALDTPEQRAELREHLDTLARTITDDVVRADYMRTWKDKTYRYFADAAREHYLSGRAKGYFSRKAPVTAEAKQISETGLGPHFVRALIYGLIIRPWKIKTHFEQLVVIASRQGNESKMLSLLLREELWDRMLREATVGEPLDVSQLDQILSSSPDLEGLQKLRRSNVLPFAFTKHANSDTDPRTDRQFDRYVRALVEIPEIDNLIESLSAMARRLGDDASVHQASVQELYKHKQQFLDSLAEMDEPSD